MQTNFGFWVLRAFLSALTQTLLKMLRFRFITGNMQFFPISTGAWIRQCINVQKQNDTSSHMTRPSLSLTLTKQVCDSDEKGSKKSSDEAVFSREMIVMRCQTITKCPCPDVQCCQHAVARDGMIAGIDHRTERRQASEPLAVTRVLNGEKGSLYSLRDTYKRLLELHISLVWNF